jgi:hypothetical protein
VGPSLSENTEDSDFAKAPDYISSTPARGKQKQTGLKNRNDVTVPVMNRDRTLHGVVSFDKEKFSSEDPSVVKPESKRPEQSAREKSVDVTRRSRQAGQTTRAGATTPPNPITPKRTESIPSRPVPESAEPSPAPKDNRAPPSTIETPTETTVPETDVPLAKRLESPEETPPPAFPAVIEEDGSPFQPDLPVAEEIGDAGRQSDEESVSEEKTKGADYGDIPVQSPVEVSFPDSQMPEPVQAEPHEEPTSRTVTEPPATETGAPRVHIGLLEVVVLAPEKAPGRKASGSPEGHNFASRHYLRNL